MSDNETPMTIAVPNNEAQTVVQSQYGMRFPDGSHVWETMVVGGGRYVTFGALARPDSGTNGRYWNSYLIEKAKDARVEPEAYAKSHQLVKRTVILVTTGAEDAAEPAKELGAPWDL